MDIAVAYREPRGEAMIQSSAVAELTRASQAFRLRKDGHPLCSPRRGPTGIGDQGGSISSLVTHY